MTYRICAVLLFPCLLFGCGGGGGNGGGGGGSDTTPPALSSAQVEPATLSSGGGAAVVRAYATDEAGVAWVRATVVRPDSTQLTVTMTPQSGNLYQGSFSAAGNTSTTDQFYTVTVTAADNRGNTTAAVSAGSLRVQGSNYDAPPPPPSSL